MVASTKNISILMWRGRPIWRREERIDEAGRLRPQFRDFAGAGVVLHESAGTR